MALKPIVPFGFLKATLGLADCMTMNFREVQPFERNEAFCSFLEQTSFKKTKEYLSLEKRPFSIG